MNCAKVRLLRNVTSIPMLLVSTELRRINDCLKDKLRGDPSDDERKNLEKCATQVRLHLAASGFLLKRALTVIRWLSLTGLF